MSKRRSSQWTLKPQDLAVAFKLAAGPLGVSYRELGAQMLLSQYEAHAAVQRLLAARLMADTGQGFGLIQDAFANFVRYGAAYAFPPVRGSVTIGFPTAYAAKPLSEQILFAQENPPVWPHPQGTHRGVALLPLYEKLPLAALKDEKLYALLALFDALRIGQARERTLVLGLLSVALGQPDATQ